MRPDVAAWLARARADAEARGLTALPPLLDALARSTAALRDADGEFGGAGFEGPSREPLPAASDDDDAAR